MDLILARTNLYLEWIRIISNMESRSHLSPEAIQEQAREYTTRDLPFVIQGIIEESND